MKENLIRQIRSAFSGLKYPGDDRIVYDNSGQHFECNQVKLDFKGKRWEETGLETLLENESSLPFFTPESFRYYLPAYLIECVRNYESFDVLVDNLLHQLTLPANAEVRMKANLYKKAPPGSIGADLDSHFKNMLESINERIHYFIDRMNGLTDPQGKAISQFLLFLSEQHADDFINDEPRTAHYRYWFKFET